MSDVSVDGSRGSDSRRTSTSRSASALRRLAAPAASSRASAALAFAMASLAARTSSSFTCADAIRSQSTLPVAPSLRRTSSV